MWNKEKKLEITQDIQLCDVSDDFGGSIGNGISRMLVIYLLIFGTAGGVMSAYDIAFNGVAVSAVIMSLAAFLTPVHNGREKLTDGLRYLVIIITYFLFSLRYRQYINSGYYSVINRIYEKARLYFGLLNGTEYLEQITDRYDTVTLFLIFIAVIGVLLLNIHFAHKAGLFRVILLTLPFLAIPIYFEMLPDISYVICVLTGYVAVWMMNAGKIKKASVFAGNILPYAFLLVFGCIRLMDVLIPQNVYEIYMPGNEAKKLSENRVTDFVLFGLASFFMEDASNAGVSGGYLGGSTVRPDYETDLIVRFTPYSVNPVYLKAFTGVDYDGDRWYSCYENAAEEDFAQISREDTLQDTAEALREYHQALPDFQGRGVMEVINVGANPEYQYYPYYTDMEESVNTEEGISYIYYPALSFMTVESEEPDDRYLMVPQSCYEAVAAVCGEAGFEGSAMDIAGQITEFFHENYTYTLKPGYQFGSSDYISYFLLRSKKGYCAHFASSAVMLFRYMGIPARYVEGYAFSYNDVLVDGELVEDAEYGDYYEGFSALGQTALINLEVSDANAHAWIEIYVEGKGWLVVDPTPAASTEEQDSFWDIFGNFSVGEPEGAGEDAQESTFLKGVGKAAEGIANFLLAMAGFLILLSVIKKTIIYRRNAKVTGAAIDDYGEIVRMVSRLHEDFASCITIREQIEWIGGFYGITQADGELAELLYQAAFGPKAAGGSEAILMERLMAIKKQIVKKEGRRAAI